MRAYFFINMYLSSIQQGIQSLHCTAEMFIKYADQMHSRQRHEILYDWARDHKTVILKNGGETEDLYEIEQLFLNESNPYPWATFSESYTALNSAFTCLGIVLPEKIYEVVDELRQMPFSRREKFLLGKGLTTFDKDLIAVITKTGLAR